MPISTPENEPLCNGLVITPEAKPPVTTSGDEPRAKAKKPPSKRQQRQAVEAVKIYTTPYTPADIVYQAREFILCTLPHRDPGNVLSWSRKNGNLTLGIVAGVNVDTGKSYGLPYGIIPRLLLVWIVTEIIRTKSRRLELGNRLADFLLKLGLDPSRGGKRSDARRVREQMERLFHASIHFLEFMNKSGLSGFAWDEGMKIAPKGVLWWSEKDLTQDALWGSWIEVSEDFYKAVMKSPNPLDIRVLRHVKDSSLGIDLYTILNREAFRAMQEDKTRFLAWEWLRKQTGNEYKGDNALANFRHDALVQIEALHAAHSGLIIKIVKGRKGQKSGLEISNLSRPSITSEEPRQPVPLTIDATARPAPALALVPPPTPPAPPPERHLRPATVGKFRALYPRLNPYDCKAAYDFWAEGLPPEKKPRHYDAAFLGFAKKWIVGKLIVSNP